VHAPQCLGVLVSGDGVDVLSTEWEVGAGGDVDSGRVAVGERRVVGVVGGISGLPSRARVDEDVTDGVVRTRQQAHAGGDQPSAGETHKGEENQHADTHSELEVMRDGDLMVKCD